jgi:hypothetical protein
MSRYDAFLLGWIAGILFSVVVNEVAHRWRR